jgi:hypothetical protein
MTDERPSALLGVAVALPVLLATFAVLTFAGLELLGNTPFSYGPERNVAEAAALGRASEVLRLLGAGQDPNRVWEIRRDMISSTITRVTALEAAIWSRRAPLIRLLDQHGAIVDAETRRHLTCLANDLPVQEIVEYLSPKGPPDCVPGQAVNAVIERSREHASD